MDRATFVLAGMAAAGAGARFNPLRLQKYFFLLDRELEGECGCPHFDFQPDKYGPFDLAVYRELEELARAGLAVVDARFSYRVHGLTDEGLDRGKRAAASMPKHVRDYFAAASSWILSIDLRELLRSIYEYAPEMAAGAVLPEAREAPREASSSHAFLRGMANAFVWPGSPSAARDGAASALGRTWAEVGDYLRAAVDRTRSTVERS